MYRGQTCRRSLITSEPCAWWKTSSTRRQRCVTTRHYRTGGPSRPCHAPALSAARPSGNRCRRSSARAARACYAFSTTKTTNRLTITIGQAKQCNPAKFRATARVRARRCSVPPPSGVAAPQTRAWRSGVSRPPAGPMRGRILGELLPCVPLVHKRHLDRLVGCPLDCLGECGYLRPVLRLWRTSPAARASDRAGSTAR